MNHKLNNVLSIVFGTALTGFSISCFVAPAKLAPGGLNGIATIVYYKLGLDMGLTMLILSVPIFILGVKIFGKKYGIKSLAGILLLAVFTTLFGQLTDYKGFLDYSDKVDVLISAIVGGFLSGTGLGFVMRTGANTGGTDIIAQIINKYTPIPLGTALFFSDGLVLLAGGMFFGLERAIFAVFDLYIAGQTINYVVMNLGTKYAKTAYIVSDKVEIISQRIIKELNRGGTILHGKGIYTKQNRDILMVVVPNNLINPLIQIIHDEDEKAFVSVNETYQVLGFGFKPLTKIAKGDPNKKQVQK